MITLSKDQRQLLNDLRLGKARHDADYLQLDELRQRGFIEITRDPKTKRQVITVTAKIDEEEVRQAIVAIKSEARGDEERASSMERELWTAVLRSIAEELRSNDPDDFIEKNRYASNIAKLALETNELEFSRWG